MVATPLVEVEDLETDIINIKPMITSWMTPKSKKSQASPPRCKTRRFKLLGAGRDQAELPALGKDQVKPEKISENPRGFLFLPLNIDGVCLHFLVDSGTSKSLINAERFLTSLSQYEEDVQAPSTQLVAANGEYMSIRGELELPLEINGAFFMTNVIVTELGQLDGILGLNFLRAYDMSLDLGRGILSCGEKLVIPLVGQTTEGCLVRLIEEVSIPGGHEITVMAEVGGNVKGEIGIIEPFQAEPNLKLVPTVVTNQSSVPVTIANEDDFDLTLEKGSVIAQMSPGELDEESIRNFPEKLEEEVHLVGDINHPEQEETLPDQLLTLWESSCKDLSEEEGVQLRNLLLEFSDVFVGSDGILGKTNVIKHTIDTGNALPIKLPPRRVPFSQMDAMQKELESMLDKGVIQPSSSPWASPVVLVKKSDGSLRFCIDYRKVNAITKKDAYPLPRIDETLDAVSGSQYFCAMDLASGFWQVEMKAEDREKTAFSTRQGLFEFLVMPFGLSNSPSTFSRLMAKVLQGMSMSEVLVYMDDILVHNKTFSETLRVLREVFLRLRKSGLKLKPKKCQLFRQSVKYLGHVIDRQGVRCDPDKIAVIEKWESPTSVEGVRSVLGTASYYRRFIKGFAEIASPLHDLLKKEVKFCWTATCQEALEKIKRCLTQAPILAFPNESGDFVLDTDACNVGIGAVLSQLQDGEEKVIAYASKALSKSQKVYCTTYKELLAVRIFVEQFKAYLYGREFVVRTDHASLKWLKNFQNPEGMVMRWISYLDTYEIHWEHRKGLKHGNADGLSRRSPTRCCKYEKCPDCGDASTFPVEVDGDDVEVINQVRSETKEEAFSNWLETTYSSKQVGNWQNKDADLNEIKEILTKKSPKPMHKEVKGKSTNFKALWRIWESLEVREGVLYRMLQLPNRILPIPQMVAPKEIRRFILENLHGTRVAGHLGVNKTIERVRKSFYWPGYREDIELWCKKCSVCAQKNKQLNRAPLKHEPVGEPLQRVGLDIVGPLPCTDLGNSYILVIVDYFTRWVEAYGIPDHTAMTVADKFVNEFVCRFGVPVQLHSDQGADFMSILFTQICELLEIDKTRTTPYRPCSNGLTERMNQTIQRLLTGFVNEARNDWDVHLPFVLMAYRSSLQESTGCSPNFLMFGREVHGPVDIMLGRDPNPERQNACLVEYVEWTRMALEKAFESVRNRMKMSVRRQERAYRTKPGPVLREGDQVWYHYLPNARKKLGKFWQGPFEILRKISDVTYQIRGPPGKQPRIVHVDDLKLVSQSTRLPEWAQEE